MTDTTDRRLDHALHGLAEVADLPAPDVGALRRRIGIADRGRDRRRHRVLAVAAAALLVGGALWVALPDDQVVQVGRRATVPPELLFRRSIDSRDPGARTLELRTPQDGWPAPGAFAQDGTVGPYGADDRFHPADDCAWEELVLSTNGSGIGTGYPAGRLTTPAAVAVRKVQTSAGTGGGGSTPLAMPTVLVVGATPGHRLVARFPDGHVDRATVSRTGVAVLVGREAPDEEVGPSPGGAVVTAVDADGRTVWRRTAATVEEVALSRPEAPCLPAPAERVGVPADAATVAAIEPRLALGLGPADPPEGLRDLVAGWTPAVETAVAAARATGRGSSTPTWTVVVDAVRVVDGRTWASVRLRDLIPQPFWVELVQEDGRWKATAATVCRIATLGCAP